MEINSLFDVFEHVLNVADGLQATHMGTSFPDVFQCHKTHKDTFVHAYIPTIDLKYFFSQ